MTRKNGDLPAMPITTDEAICQMTGTTKPEFSGLSKREQFAAMAMQGLLSKHGDDDYQCEQISSYAVAHADALLKELERTK
jgi:hypothetical protein